MHVTYDLQWKSLKSRGRVKAEGDLLGGRWLTERVSSAKDSLEVKWQIKQVKGRSSSPSSSRFFFLSDPGRQRWTAVNTGAGAASAGWIWISSRPRSLHLCPVASICFSNERREAAVRAAAGTCDSSSNTLGLVFLLGPTRYRPEVVLWEHIPTHFHLISNSDQGLGSGRDKNCTLKWRNGILI